MKLEFTFQIILAKTHIHCLFKTPSFAIKQEKKWYLYTYFNHHFISLLISVGVVVDFIHRVSCFAILWALSSMFIRSVTWAAHSKPYCSLLPIYRCYWLITVHILLIYSPIELRSLVQCRELQTLYKTGRSSVSICIFTDCFV